MVRGYEGWFFDYLKAIKKECVKRGIETVNNWNAIKDIREHANEWSDGLRLCGGVTSVSMTRTRLTSIVKIPFITLSFVM